MAMQMFGNMCRLQGARMRGRDKFHFSRGGNLMVAQNNGMSTCMLERARLRPSVVVICRWFVDDVFLTFLDW